MESNNDYTNTNTKIDYEEFEDDFDAESTKKKFIKSRRTKGSLNGNDYNCGCGKRYFSYAALYTHAKLKHEGIFPEGTINLKKLKQGRPKKDNWSCTKLNKNIEKAYEYNTKLISYIEMIKNGQRNNLEEFSSYDILEEFPINFFKDKSFYEPILFSLDSIIKKNKLDYDTDSIYENIEKNIFDNLITGYNCVDAFSTFIIYISKYIKKDFYKECVFIMCCLLNYTNFEAYELCKIIDLNVFKEENKEFCLVNDPEVIPDLFNKFVPYYLYDILDGNKFINPDVQLKFFNNDKVNIIKIVLFLKHFGYWLYVFKMTKAKIDLKQNLN